ncbi:MULTISPECIES: hypothetical protein [Carnobacterium]|uniref:DUF3098 domain-containing protein n=1 Tax=Carnobacterium antarcticum TaxID=2126436 RepID=A0ABW4NJR7_9LACT|nr:MULTISPECIES: hypothetical protein [unclassified Carnobacterium]ALV21781.1 hypothetical protein NY10_1172 [Carnobacterium sp. CP1]QQP69779.1 hypothetical protein JHE06_09235 [Carnobacterium sp. CS13]
MFNIFGKIMIVIGLILIIFGYFGPVKSGDPIIGSIFILVGLAMLALAFVVGKDNPRV